MPIDVNLFGPFLPSDNTEQKTVLYLTGFLEYQCEYWIQQNEHSLKYYFCQIK